MKPIKDIISMLVNELINHIDKIDSKRIIQIYYNDILGDTSFLLAGLLESLLKKNYSDWSNKKWIDDSLITKVDLRNDILKISGVMIWGIENKTEQWTEPFLFEITLVKQKASFKEFTFLFGDLNFQALIYESYKDNTDYWKNTDRNWKYIINSNIVLT